MVAGKADAVPQVKRKREALGEVPKVPENLKGKPASSVGSTDLKGKEKVKEVKESFEGVILKHTTTTTTTTRRPLRTVVDESSTTTAVAATTHRTRNTTSRQLQPLREHDEDAMAVDPQPPAPVPSPKRFVAAREAQRTGVPAASRVPRRVSKPSKPEDEDEEEAHRVFKKRRTSSDMPDVDAEALQEEEVENAVAPKEEEETENWVDLDADDCDDPLMVSEYVIEIFEYLKEVEVRPSFTAYMRMLLTVRLH